MHNFREIFRLTPDQVAVIVKEIDDHNELWTNHGLRTGIDSELNPFRAQYEIICRYNNPALANEPDFDWRECVDFPAMRILTNIRKYVYALMHTFECDRLGRVMVTSLPAGAVIKPHTDSGHMASPVAEYYNRFHLCLEDNPETVFRCGDEHYRPEIGQVFWFNNALEHEVINNGSTDRWTVITDLKKPTFLAEFVKETTH